MYYYTGDSLSYHNNMNFTTKDRDNDVYLNYNCAELRQGTWWYRSCDFSNLNGLYINSKTSVDKHNVWDKWPGGQTNMKLSTMMIRKCFN